MLSSVSSSPLSSRHRCFIFPPLTADAHATQIKGLEMPDRRSRLSLVSLRRLKAKEATPTSPQTPTDDAYALADEHAPLQQNTLCELERPPTHANATVNWQGDIQKETQQSFGRFQPQQGLYFTEISKGVTKIKPLTSWRGSEFSRRRLKAQRWLFAERLTTASD